MNARNLEEILTKLADIEEGVAEYLSLGQIDSLSRCLNDGAYDDIWSLRFELSNKYQLWDVLRLEKSAQASRFRPYRQADFRCCRSTPTPIAPCITLIYAYRGDAELTLPDTGLTLREGELCLVNSGTVMDAASTAPGSFFLTIFFNKLYLNGEMLHRFPVDSLFSPFFEQALFGAEHGMDYLIFDIRDCPRARDYYMTCVETFLFKPHCHQEIESSLLFLLFCELMTLWEGHRDPVRPIRTEISAYDIINYITANFRTVTLTSISEHFHFSPDHMRKTIKALMNKNFLDIVQDVRLNHACKLLRETELPVAEVVENCGYHNLSHFYTLFKKRYRCSPADYRQQWHARPGAGAVNDSFQNG